MNKNKQGYMKVGSGLTNWKKIYERWDQFPDLDEELRSQLDDLKGNKNALEESFYQDLTFGTGGMRGKLGPGTNRMNIYSVRKAVNGLANYLISKGTNTKDDGVVIAYDSRYMSQEFAIEAAKVLGVFGIKTYIFSTLRPTPVLSFAVRYLRTSSGIMITASHNPPAYNGFKVYNEDGGQVTLEDASEIIAAVQQVEEGLTVPVLERTELEEQGLLQWVDSEIDQAYLKQLLGISKMDSDTTAKEKDLNIVFTPLHGTGKDAALHGLKQLNFTNVSVVAEQADPDPEFSTVTSPNPEESQAFELAIKQGKELAADILLATDPDADRLGVAVQDGTGDYRLLTGNQLGVLLLDYILAHTDEDILKNGRALHTIVTTELGRVIAESYGVKTDITLTGFKYIGEKIREYDEVGGNFLFGFEESYGYLIDGFARDKDAIQAVVMACEMAYYWKQNGKTLLDVLNNIYEKHGFYLEGITQLTLEGIEGSAKITKVMEHVRTNPFQELAGLRVEKLEDYLSSERISVDGSEATESINLPKENVLKFILENDSWVCLRPSGTEPKIKSYYGACGKNYEESQQRLESIQKALEQIVNEIISD
jgi:phosphoglucomutase